MRTVLTRLLLLLFYILPYQPFAQTQDTLSAKPVDKKKLNIVTITSATGYTAALIGLNELWYKNSAKESFHFFNDLPEWKQVDKIGHFYSAFYGSYATSNALQWCNVDKKKSALIGSLTGFMIMVPVEIFDGYSSAYGASVGDLLANTAGASFFLAQSLTWQEVRIYPKFSFHSTHYAGMRPNVLGDTWPSQTLKDYNGQTHWLSVDVDKFMRFPKWLNLAVGYGAEQMIYARDQQNIKINLDPYRQYYFSIDFDLTAIKTKSKAIKTLIFIANMIKLPAPAVEFSRKGIKCHGLYF
jgi:hypothetical protein